MNWKFFSPKYFEPGEPENNASATTDDWWRLIFPENEFDNIGCSGKLMLLFSILSECNACGDKLLVFSQSIGTLNVIEKFLSMITENTKNSQLGKSQFGRFTGEWTKGRDYFRLDGSTSTEIRKKIVIYSMTKRTHRLGLL